MESCRVLIQSKELQELFKSGIFDAIPHRFLKKEEICYPDTPRILILKKGELEISLCEEDKELILYFLHENNFCFCSTNCVVKARKNSEFYFLDSTNYAKVFEYPEFCNMLLNALHQNISLEREIIKSLAFKSAKERVVDFFVKTALSIGEKKEDGIVIEMKCGISQTASFLGMSRQRLSTFLNEMIAAGVVEKITSKSYLIKDLYSLKRFA